MSRSDSPQLFCKFCAWTYPNITAAAIQQPSQARYAILGETIGDIEWQEANPWKIQRTYETKRSYETSNCYSPTRCTRGSRHEAQRRKPKVDAKWQAKEFEKRGTELSRVLLAKRSIQLCFEGNSLRARDPDANSPKTHRRENNSYGQSRTGVRSKNAGPSCRA